MPLLSTPVSRRYTPPTCTLEITAQTSALSRWTGQPVLKQLQFQLSLEARRWGEPVQIRGDRRQLEALGEAVESYVQQLLSQTSTDLSAAPPAATEPQPDFPEPAVSRLDPLQAAPPGSFDRIQLQPKSFLSHDLFLGPLANETSGSVVNLSASGLFDLATALEESTAEASTLPPQRSLQNPPLWTRVAAIAVLFVGVTTAVQLSNNSADPERPTGDYPAEISQRANELPGASPLPPPPNAALPPFQLPPITVSPTPSSAPPLTTLEVSPGQNQVAPNAQRSAAPTPVPTPKAPLPNITVQPEASSDGSALPTIPDLETPAGTESLSARENTASKATQPSQTTFDGVPQVAEVRSYFQKRWQPPQSLDQTLEYTLSLNPNGSIQQIIPLNQAAKTYLDRTPIPLRNEPFVSPIQGNPKIRLVLGADGGVKAFLQSAN